MIGLFSLQFERHSKHVAKVEEKLVQWGGAFECSFFVTGFATQIEIHTKSSKLNLKKEHFVGKVPKFSFSNLRLKDHERQDKNLNKKQKFYKRKMREK